ncbi:carbon-nitrogen hydrolase [Scheffersomyces amazonensis]|uniref:carbon-nitrogen hydrolase n=1 Tax=Scheffersomyces amazonensis TaxID=1078765 RepID=UPI00315DFEAE
MNTIKLRIACVQYNPRIGQIDSNISHVKRLLLSSNLTKPDIIILPELAVTGYNFKDKDHIQTSLDSLQNIQSGKSIKFGQELSKLYNCFTIIGYPEKFQGSTIYNSAVLISPIGTILHNYRKTFLYETDEKWGCSENPQRGFKSIDVVFDREFYTNPDPQKNYSKVRTNFGICMDLNPYKFEAPFNEFEFSLASYIQGAKLILCPMAWLSPLSPSITKVSKYELENENEADDSTVNYWILRFFPFLSHRNSILPKSFGKVNVVCCNRIGLEDDVLFGGSSSVIEFDSTKGLDEKINSENPSVNVLGSLGKNTEGVLIRDIEVELD